ncbi:hypothetical protein D3C78_1214400 [compost metagenome]
MATPGFGLQRLGDTLALAAHRCAELFLQGVQGGDLGPQQISDGLVGVGIALVGELGHLRQHAVGVVPAFEDLFGQSLLVFADGNQQRAITGFLLGVGSIWLAVEENVFVGRQAAHYDAGFAQGLRIYWFVAVDQLLDLTADQVLLVWPELYLPGTVALGQRADQQRLQFSPGFLSMEKVGAGGGQVSLAFAKRQGTHRQLAVGFDPAAVGRQDHLFGDCRGGHRLRILRRAGAQGKGGEAGEQQFGTEHARLLCLKVNSGTPATQRVARH